MAQEEGPPRKTTPFNKFSGMASQNDRYNTKDDEMFWLENIMRTGPRKLSSVPGPGPGVSLFGQLYLAFPPYAPQFVECVDFNGSVGVITQQNRCGFFLNMCVPAIYVGVDSSGNAYTQLTYKDNVVGTTATSGPALSIAADATRTDFTGYAAIYNSTLHTITLGKWINQALTSIPTVLGTFSVTLAINDVVKISKNQTTHAVSVRVNGTIQISVVDIDIPFANPGFGVVGVGLTTDESSQDWSGFTVSCSEYVGGGGIGHSVTDHCCDAAPVGLSIQCCSAQCDFPCSEPGPGGNAAITLKACGGIPPYQWSGTDTVYTAPAIGDSSVCQAAANYAFFYASFAWGIVSEVWQTDCLRPIPGGGVDVSNINSTKSINLVQALYDCSGGFLRTQSCEHHTHDFSPARPDPPPNNVTCTEIVSGQIVSTLHSVSFNSTDNCQNNGGITGADDGFASINLDGTDYPGFAFDGYAHCLGRQDAECYDTGFTAPTGEEFMFQTWIIGGQQSVGAPVVEVFVQDSIGSIASVIIDVL